MIFFDLTSVWTDLNKLCRWHPFPSEVTQLWTIQGLHQIQTAQTILKVQTQQYRSTGNVRRYHTMEIYIQQYSKSLFHFIYMYY